MSSEDVARAVAKAKFLAAQDFEGTRALSHETIATGLLDDSSASLDSVLDKFESIKAADVSSAAQTLLKSKPSSVALGDVKQLPYADELF